MVAYDDGSVLAQMGNPDMRTPIAHAMAWPERIESGVEPLDLLAVQSLNFSQADEQRFPCLKLAREAMRSGGSKMIQLNAANEIAVGHFLNKALKYTDIAAVIDYTLEHLDNVQVPNLDDIIEQDKLTRHFVESHIKTL